MLSQELEHAPLYPSEILPLFLYLGERRHAYNPSLNHDMKIHSHVNMAYELHTAFPDSIRELHVAVEDNVEVNLLDKFQIIYDFIGNKQYNTIPIIISFITLNCQNLVERRVNEF